MIKDFRKWVVAAAVAMALPSCENKPSCQGDVVYEYDVIDNQGKKFCLDRYKGKVLLIVNTATQCGFTPQYAELQSLYEKYNKQGFEILDFPCNQFAEQAPGTDAQIDSFCQVNYHTTFPRFRKTIVNSVDLEPADVDANAEFYVFLEVGLKYYDTSNLIVDSTITVRPDSTKYVSVIEDRNIRWNFTKFLVDKKGHVIKRFEPGENMEVMEPFIQHALEESQCNHSVKHIPSDSILSSNEGFVTTKVCLVMRGYEKDGQ